MDDRARSFIVDAINICDGNLDRVNRWSDEEIKSDEDKQLSLEHRFQMLGESLARVRRRDPAILADIADAHRAIGMRKILVHQYYDVGVGTVLKAARSNVAQLKKRLEELAEG